MTDPTSTTTVSPDTAAAFSDIHAASHAVPDRVLRALHLLRHARDAGAVPGGGAIEEPGLRHRRRDRRRGLRVCTSRGTYLVSLIPAAGSPIASSVSATRGVHGVASSSPSAISSWRFRQTPRVLLGLAVMVVGIGLLKPNISAIVGALYKAARRAARRGILDLLHGHQYSARCRLVPRRRRPRRRVRTGASASRLRRRHGPRPAAIRVHAQASRRRGLRAGRGRRPSARASWTPIAIGGALAGAAPWASALLAR